VPVGVPRTSAGTRERARAKCAIGWGVTIGMAAAVLGDNLDAEARVMFRCKLIERDRLMRQESERLAAGQQRRMRPSIVPENRAGLATVFDVFD
jgi:hypothetical protein